MKSAFARRGIGFQWAATAAAVFFLFFTIHQAVAQDTTSSGEDQNQPQVSQPTQQGQQGEAGQQAQPAQQGEPTQAQEPAAAEPAAAEEDSEELNRLFADANLQASQLLRDAHELEAYHPVRASRELHGEQLNMIRDHVNQLGKLEQQMRDERENGAAWQQGVVDQLRPMLEELAGNMEETIAEYNSKARPLHFNAEYKTLAKANARLASELHGLIHDAVRYGHSKRGFDRIQQTMRPQQ